MKFAVEWHERCLKNTRASIEEDKKRVFEATARLKWSIFQADFKEKQIAEARRRGMAAFDDEKLLVKRKAKV